jgi:hypothetical protein
MGPPAKQIVEPLLNIVLLGKKTIEEHVRSKVLGHHYG